MFDPDTVKAGAIILAGGSGSRMNSDTPKQLLELKGRPVIYYALKAFQESRVEKIILVSSLKEMETMKELVADYGFSKVVKTVPGGKERYDSVYEGLKALEDVDIVLIHDGVRPFVSREIIEANISDCCKHGACITAVETKDTIKIADNEGFVAETPERKYVNIIQTPQTFEYSLIREAYDYVIKNNAEGITDDAMVLERYGCSRIHLCAGSFRNIKITTSEDIKIAEVFFTLDENTI